MREIKVEIIKKCLLFRKIKVTLENGYFYDVFEDGDTESVSFYNPDGEWIENLISCFTAYPNGFDKISDVLLDHIEKKDLGNITLVKYHFIMSNILKNNN